MNLVVLILAVFLSALSFTKQDLPWIVKTTEGQATGFSFNGTRYWFNLPYAQPPVGELRFAPPKKAKPYSGGSYEATDYKNPIICAQPGANSSREDCLYLDIYAPADASDEFPEGYPVFLFIHGGSFLFGHKMDGYDGSNFARNKTVFVSINYRLNFFGWLRIDKKTPGNYGFLDQIMALEWIKQNIAEFGGNPDMITIGGQSAGANSVLLHMVSPKSKDLFHQVISQSPMSFTLYPTKQDSLETAYFVSSLINCSFGDTKCLRSLSTSSLMDTALLFYTLCLSSEIPYYAFKIDLGYWTCGMAPEVGNEALPEQPNKSYKNGNVKPVPIMIGFATNEGLRDSESIYNPIRYYAADLYAHFNVGYTSNLYIKYINQLVDHTSYENNSKAETKLLSERAQLIYDQYPVKTNKGFKDMYPNSYNGFNSSAIDANYMNNALYHDRVYFCAGRRMVKQVISSLGNKSEDFYFYQFRFVPSFYQYWYEEIGNPTSAVSQNFWSENLYSSHGAEIPFVFSWTSLLLNENESLLARRVLATWVNFIHTGNPNKGPMDAGKMNWEVYDPNAHNILVFGDPQEEFMMESDIRTKQCNFWDQNGYEF